MFLQSFSFIVLLGDFDSGPKVAYQSLIEQKVLMNDENQYLLIEKLDELFHRIKGYHPHKPGVLSKVCCIYILLKYNQDANTLLNPKENVVYSMCLLPMEFPAKKCQNIRF